MLEIKNLTKIYRSKGGAEVKALDGVTLSFPATGLVFLLGKSGSGKSTLLNLAGGLDEPTAGEIVVMGRSSRDFTGGDFDSYRNTYVGFIFQEYNVLDEFTVEDNVALALELQGKKKDPEIIGKILSDVGLSSYARRRPNTLSGGQKQRVAIARALVKDPQIIMADEPTGALDSATGRQVFDTLKKLSKSRLVLVVSHDREFAEEYGDRIIELKDGRVISDVTKVCHAPAPLSEKVTRIDGDTLSIKGAPDGETMHQIEEFLRGSDGEVLIARGEKGVSSFKRINRISEDGRRQSFADTPPAVPSGETQEATFIRSRLPALKALRIGASGLKLKPFRLILTILLSAAAFIMFGLASTMMLYSERDVLVNSFLESDFDYLKLNKRYQIRHYYSDDPNDYTSLSQDARFTPAEKNTWGEQAIGVCAVSMNFSNLNDDGYYYRPHIASVASDAAPLGQRLLAGGFPQSDTEVCVSSYLLACAQALDYYPLDETGKPAETPIEISSAQDFIGQKLLCNGTALTVCGVFDSGDVPKKYDNIKDLSQDTMSDIYQALGLYSYTRYLDEGLHALAIATQSLAERYSTFTEPPVVYFNTTVLPFVTLDASQTETSGFRSIAVYDTEAGRPLLPVITKGDIVSLQGDEILIPLMYLPDFCRAEQLGETDIVRIDEVVNRVYPEASISQEDAAFLQEFLAAHPLKITFYTALFSVKDVQYQTFGTFEVKGVILPTDTDAGIGIYCSQETYERLDVYEQPRTETNYVPEADALFDALLVPVERTASALNAVFDAIGVIDPDTDVFCAVGNSLYSDVSRTSDVIAELSIVFLSVGIVLAVFAALLLFNFISLSISNKRKEIGILRAVGARGTDVFKIFFAESGIIVGICTLLALIGTTILAVLLNNVLKGNLGFEVTLFVFGPVPILLMIAIALLIALLSTFLPVFFAARKKPVDSIRAL